MARPSSSRPTDAELEILKVLWARGPSTVKEVQEHLNRVRRTGYTTVLKFLQIMTEKELVTRDETNRTHIYHARQAEDQTQRQFVKDLLVRVFSGSAPKLVAQALLTQKASSNDLAQIRQMLDNLERGNK